MALTQMGGQRKYLHGYSVRNSYRIRLNYTTVNRFCQDVFIFQLKLLTPIRCVEPGCKNKNRSQDWNVETSIFQPIKKHKPVSFGIMELSWFVLRIRVCSWENTGTTNALRLCKADIRNPLRYLLMNAAASRSVSGGFQLPLTEVSPLTRRLVLRALEAGECLSAFNLCNRICRQVNGLVISDLSDFSSVALSSIDVATTTHHFSALNIKNHPSPM